MRTAIYGSRIDAHARVVAKRFGDGSDLEFVGLVDDYPENAGRRVGELEVLGRGVDLARPATEGLEAVVLGFGSAQGRRAVIETIVHAGLALPVLVHAGAHVAGSASIGDGCQVIPGALIGPGAVIDRGALVNSGAVIEHDVRLGEAVVVDPGAVLARRVTVRDWIRRGGPPRHADRGERHDRSRRGRHPRRARRRDRRGCSCPPDRLTAVGRAESGASTRPSRG